MIIDKKTQYCQDLSSFQLISRFNTIPVKIPISYSVDIDTVTLSLFGEIEDQKQPR